jgi:signal transduction histidine kinase
MERTIQAFLDFARPPTMERRSFDIHNVVDQTLTLLAGRAASKGVALEANVPSRPLPIEGDPGQIRQVVLNLVLNALDASDEGSTVRVAVIEDEKPANGEDASAWLSIRVSDDGPGFPIGIGERIFEPFYSTKETGLGLGLPVCRRIVAEHGGTIDASNRPRGGAEVVVRLPRVGQQPAAPGDDDELIDGRLAAAEARHA